MSMQPTHTPNVGEFWPAQGGVYAGLQRNPTTDKSQHVIMAVDELQAAPWGQITESPASSYWDGAENTAQLLRNFRSIAWQPNILDSLQSLIDQGPHLDWVIPSVRQMGLLVCNLPDLLLHSNYWTSTQYNAVSAWAMLASSGAALFLPKDAAYPARAIRCIPAHPVRQP